MWMKDHYAKSFAKLLDRKDALNMTPLEVRIHIYLYVLDSTFEIMANICRLQKDSLELGLLKYYKLRPGL